MTSATDIITYVGIPLAVLGVLPILYTFAIAIINQRRVRRALIHHGHKPLASSKRQEEGFTIRSSPMTTLIEVELPKYAIALLDRHDERYWKAGGSGGDGTTEHDRLLTRAESSLSTIEEGRVQGYLRGGSWRAFNWKKLIVGKKLYRIQYEDELREPPAEIDFADLINFLLDWGAELDPMGWEKLRSGGLWTPAGTVLLRLAGSKQMKHSKDWVLRTSMPDEGDGILTLCVRWPSDCYDITSTRGVTSLPPGWGRLYQPVPPPMEGKEKDEVPDEDRKSLNKELTARIADLKSTTTSAADSTSMRFKSDMGEIGTLYLEHNNAETGNSIELSKLSKFSQGQAWFTTIASSLLLVKPATTQDLSGALWGLTPPADLLLFARKDSLPIGVLDLLGIVPSDKVPQWTTVAQDDMTNWAALHHQKFQARLAAERMEAVMSPEQAKVARSNRLRDEQRDTLDTMRMRERQNREREEQRLQDAITSTRMMNKVVAEYCLTWLAKNGQIGQGWTIYDVVEAVLYLLVLDNMDDEKTEGFRVMTVLDEWASWTNAGGMKKDQFAMLEKSKVEFCFAVCMVALVHDALLHGQGMGAGKASVDMLSCIDLWKKVRLG